MGRWFGLMALIALLGLSGCTSTMTSKTIGGHTFNDIPCALIGVAVGAAAGGAVASGGGAAIGALGGVVMSEYVCGTSDELSDEDGDWIADEVDQCPDTAPGIEVDRKGCPLDSDGDGVADLGDKCPQTYGLSEFGCPLDSDGDGFADDVDACPDEPAPESGDGCPMTAMFIEAVHFNFDSAEISPISQSVLDARALVILRENPSMRVTIEGHTDDFGNDRYNQKLSLRRAEAVRRYLVSQGIEESRLSIDGQGESKPADTNATRAGRANNRRVEFIIH